MNQQSFAIRARLTCAIALVSCLAYLPALANTGPASAAAPDFAACAMPVWPKGVLRAEQDGKVVLHFRVGADGIVQETRVSESSGDALLDEAARERLLRCTLAPSAARGETGAWYPIQWSWTLEDGTGKWRLGGRPAPFADTPQALRAFILQARQADAIADPLERCLAFPDMPGNEWPAGLSQSYCKLVYGKRTTLKLVAELVDSGALAKLDALYRLDLKRHFSKGDFSEDIHLDIKLFDASDEAARVSEKWLTKAPGSAFANAARAQHLLGLASQARGARLARDTSKESMQRMSALAGRASEYFGKALRIEPRLLPAHAGLIDLARMDGRRALGDAAFARGEAIDPACRYLNRERMVALQPRWGGSEEAMQDYARKLAPLVAARPLVALSIILPAYDRGNVLFAQYKYAEAVAVMTAAVQFAPYPDVAGRLGVSMWQNRDFSAQTLVALLVAYRYNVDDLSTARARGAMLLDMNDPEWALASLRRTVALNPDDHYAKGLLDRANGAMSFKPLPIISVRAGPDKPR